jgi:hypothetical protein
LADRTERIRLLLIGSTVVAAAITVILGVPRLRGFITPEIERVWVVSAALGDAAASTAPKNVLQGTPVTLLAIIEGRPPFASETRLYGAVDEVILDPAAGPRPVQAWSDWWYGAEFLWLKVEPLRGYANPEFETAFDPEEILFADSYQVAWGFAPTHAADVSPAGDVFPDLDTGTMRFAARAVVRDWRDRILQQVQSPSAAGVHAASPAARPHRVSVRAADDAMGWLQAYAGLAYVPFSETDSMPHPVREYLGGTVLTYWLRAQQQAGGYDGRLQTWEQLEAVADVVVDDMFLASDGAYYWTRDPLRPVDWGTVQVGDILAIEDHVGIVFEDRGPGGGGDGVLNRWDEAWEAYFEPLRTTQLGEAFEADISVWRLRPAAAPGGE